MRGVGAIRGLGRASLFLGFLFSLPVVAAHAEEAPRAGAFVYPVGDEQDFTKPAPGESAGFRISDPYLAVRGGRKNRPRRIHYGVDFSNGGGGHTVRAVAAGVVDVSDGNALVKMRKAQRVKVPRIVKGKRVYRWATRYRTTHKWRTGWGNRVVVRHTLPNGQTVYSLYAHLMPRSVIVQRGDIVTAGQPLGKVGRTGRATAAHLHLEIRTTRVDEDEEVSDPDDESSPGEERMQTAVPHTVDPVAFLETRVLRFHDLTPGSWQARYALAAVKDGVMRGTKEKFEPDDSISRESFYLALVSTFHLGTSLSKDDFDSNVDALIDAGILDAAARSEHQGSDRVTRSGALELVLRCLDRRSAVRGGSLARIGTDQLARDFNREFAGRAAAAAAETEARSLASKETAELKKQAAARAARAAKEAKAHGRRSRVRPAKVTPVKPTPILDPGFESLAGSAKHLSRAEACLLLASALRLKPSQVSALERAAARVANSG